jgi:basic membrane lipoprotein Med (substrate-binding protein (PBP1-ABC) superfamily)/DNA-binding SARP family transcriptional activator
VHHDSAGVVLQLEEGMEYHVLGPLEVLEGSSPVDIGSRQQRALLALLLVNVNRVVSTDRILEEFWPDDPEGKEKTLWVFISRLRSSLEPGREARSRNAVLITRDHGYSLRIDPDDIDSHRFERTVEQGRALVRDHPAAASEHLREALDLWHGSAFEDFAYDEFAQMEIARLEELRLVATEDRIDADLRSGLHRDVIGELVGLVREYPLRERPVSLLMTALYRSGRQADALRAFQMHARTIGEELGIEASPELCRLEEQVLLHDPRLVPARTTAERVVGEGMENPFKGLRAFSEADVGRFFGRDRIVTELVRRLADDRRLLGLIGASGSGKSSILRAGLIPAIRKGAVGDSDNWLIAQMVPGARPFTELEAALLRSTLDAPDSLAELLDHAEDGLQRAALRMLPEDSGRLLLVIDQFEELFTLVESEEERGRFVRSLEVALSDPHGRIVVVIALRADFYDRPLEYVGFAGLLSEGVVNTMPLTPDELEVAAEQPAAMAGVQLETTLLARLLTDVAGQSGGLPLFQYALTELFDRRSGDLLTAEVYEDMGGVQGAITRRAEDLFQTFDPAEQEACRQLFLRLVTIVGVEAWSRRRVAASEVTSIDVDIVDLQTVLEKFGSFRLLTFDRDYVSGSPTVEVAHEALLGEWSRLRGWIEDGRDDVLRHARLTAAITEWRSSSENADYLLSGERLRNYEQWALGSTLRLIAPEQRFLDESIDQREEKHQRETQRSARESKLDGQARRRLWGLGGVVVLLGVIFIGILMAVFGAKPIRIVVVHGARGDLGINDLMAAGAAAAERGLDITIERLEPLIDPEADLRQLADTGAALIIVSREYDLDVERVAPDYPEVRFVAIDPVALHIELPNITEMHFAVEDSAFLAGAAAARMSKTGVVGFVGALQTLPSERSRTGFEQGARYGDPDVTVLSTYLGPVENPRATARARPQLAYEVSTVIYGKGADVVFHDAGESGAGVLKAARELSTDQHLWVIGSDTDEYQITLSEIDRSHVLSSAIKRYDTAVSEAIEAFLDDSLETGELTLGLAEDGVGLSRSGDQLGEIDGYLKNLDGEVAFGHINVFGNSLIGPEWQRDPDLVIKLEMTETACVGESSGDRDLLDGRIRVERGSVVVFEYTNRTDVVGGLAIRTIAPGVSLSELREEAKDGIPVSFDAVLGISAVEPGATTRVAALMTGSPFVPNCFLFDATNSPTDFPALIVSAGV